MASANKIQYGLSNLYVAKMIVGEGGAISYGTPFKIPGAISFSADAEGDTNPFYADNMVYYTSVSNNGYSGEIEVAKIPDQFLIDILGQTADTNGALFESNNDTNSAFALMGQFEGDAKNRRFVYYNCKASRPSAEANTTEDAIEPATETISITMTPRTTDNVVKAVMELSSSNATAYNAFFTSVYEKDTTPQEPENQEV